MTDKFICAMCRGEFDKGQSDEIAEAELKENFGKGISIDDCVRVCDGCYEKVKPSANPECFADWQANQ